MTTDSITKADATQQQMQVEPQSLSSIDPLAQIKQNSVSYQATLAQMAEVPEGPLKESLKLFYCTALFSPNTQEDVISRYLMTVFNEGFQAVNMDEFYAEFTQALQQTTLSHDQAFLIMTQISQGFSGVIGHTGTMAVNQTGGVPLDYIAQTQQNFQVQLFLQEIMQRLSTDIHKSAQAQAEAPVPTQEDAKPQTKDKPLTLSSILTAFSSLEQNLANAQTQLGSLLDIQTQVQQVQEDLLGLKAIFTNLRDTHIADQTQLAQPPMQPVLAQG